MDRAAIINLLAEKIGAKTYLEIGVERGNHVRRINIENKFGVDPWPMYKRGRQETTHVMTSDDFFSQNDQKFDIIFIDGMHLAENVHSDILNSLQYLNEGGYIVCHDMNPLCEAAQEREQRTERWNGDCWKAWVHLRFERKDLEMCVVDTDFGCGVIKFGAREPIGSVCEELTYENLRENRKEWLNLISTEEFLHRFDLVEGEING